MEVAFLTKAITKMGTSICGLGSSNLISAASKQHRHRGVLEENRRPNITKFTCVMPVLDKRSLDVYIDGASIEGIKNRNR